MCNACPARSLPLNLLSRPSKIMGKNRQNWTAEPWGDSEELEFAMVIPETDDFATIAFRAPSGAWFDYKPGQFLTLDLPLPSGTIQRTYTISSSPSRAKRSRLRLDR